MAFQLGSGAGSGSRPSSSSGHHHLNSPFGATTYTKVFVGGLAWETQSETLGRYFDQFGEILEAVVIADKFTGKSKGYGFVTFRDPESARRACADPNPVIDGRRANCNLASLGRPQVVPPYGRLRPPGPYFGGGHGHPRGSFVGNPNYQPLSPFGYQHGFVYSPYGYATFDPEQAYAQNIYDPYTARQYLQIYGVPGTFSTSGYSAGQLGQLALSGHSYTAAQGYAMPRNHSIQFSGATAAPLPTIQAPYSPVTAQSHFQVPSHSLQLIKDSGSDQTTG